MKKVMLDAMLRRLRTEHELTQEQIAKMFDLSFSAYSLYETGKREPPLAFVIRLADYYNVSLDYMTGRVDAPKDFSKEKVRLEKDATAAKIMSEALFLKENSPEDYKKAVDYFDYVYQTVRLHQDDDDDDAGKADK